MSCQLSWYSAAAYVLLHLAALCPSLSKEGGCPIARMGAAIAAEAVEPPALDGIS